MSAPDKYIYTIHLQVHNGHEIKNNVYTLFFYRLFKFNGEKYSKFFLNRKTIKIIIYLR